MYKSKLFLFHLKQVRVIQAYSVWTWIKSERYIRFENISVDMFKKFGNNKTLFFMHYNFNVTRLCCSQRRKAGTQFCWWPDSQSIPHHYLKIFRLNLWHYIFNTSLLTNSSFWSLNGMRSSYELWPQSCRSNLVETVVVTSALFSAAVNLQREGLLR